MNFIEASRRAFDLAKEKDLVRRAQRGDKKAFDALIKPYEQRLLSLAKRLNRELADAEDVRQEAFLRIWKAMPNLSDTGKFIAFASRVLSWHSIDVYRGKEGEMKNVKPLEGVNPAGEIFERPLADATANPESILVGKESVQIMCDAIQSLPEHLRVPFVLYTMDGLSYKEIADTQEVPLGDVKNHIFRARARLMRILKPHRDEWQPTPKDKEITDSTTEEADDKEATTP